MRFHPLALGLAAALAIGCASPVAAPSDAADVATPDAQVRPAYRCEAREVPCVASSIQRLGLLTDRNSGAITTEGELTVLDATSGGRMPTESYLYARFTTAGLVKVELHDEEALESMDWDIAFRRSVVRLNSGVSGPSCVEGTEAPEGLAFEQVTRVEPSTSFRRESYLTPINCYYVSDGQGIGGPGTVLARYWRFANNCLQMTGETFMIRLRDDRVVKLQVRGYYDVESQRLCDEGGEVPMSDNGAATIRLRWSFVPR